MMAQSLTCPNCSSERTYYRMSDAQGRKQFDCMGCGRYFWDKSNTCAHGDFTESVYTCGGCLGTVRICSNCEARNCEFCGYTKDN